MPLTPADVHNVAFSKPPIGKRGYNEDEVDAFLDPVEAELARLVEENQDLRNQVEQLESQLQSTQVELEEARSQASAAPAEEPRRLTPVPAPAPAEQTSPGGDHHVQAAKVLGLAMAGDDLVNCVKQARRPAQARRGDGQHHAGEERAGEEDRDASHLRARIPHPVADLPRVPAPRTAGPRLGCPGREQWQPLVVDAADQLQLRGSSS